ncbi:glycosyltransferase involved in cell wall biosynthesis [Methylobacter tundripaludum]|uniref:Glycosyltransferase involved in cell wall biosynthesis n=1 Tax=Methylobacter tundripaludum TaxID=173365 RepID=A0A2S6HCV4_9GAMM|nr:glycosyltransferase family 4 protein [Methylobacter tundripaludum]PPK75280.1 glycosyltransferase involved in cell wall biosynthesis [Methylobacter tundripaludum]
MNQNQIAYFINQYPKVSHSFIRREILALERQGFDIFRIALRGWDAEVVDAEDKLERERTQYVLQSGVLGLIAPVIQTLLRSPVKFLSSLKLAVRMGIRADRAWPYHLVYLAEACRMLSWVQAKDIRHIHAHFGTNSAEVVMLLKLLGGPGYSFTVHGPEEFDKPEFIKLREKVSHAAFVVAISSFGRSQLFRWINYQDWNKVQVVHCGLEPSFHEDAVQPVTSAPRLVCVGRLSEQKGQLLLVDAVSKLLAKGIDIELVLAGDGEMRPEIEALIKQHSLESKVIITGWISSKQVREEILASRAMVQPSFAEGLPVVIMEAMALRRPVLTTYVAGIPELVRPGENGWLFPAGDVDELVKVLEDFLHTPTEILEKMGQAAHQRVLERHSIDVEAAKLARLFAQAISLN